ncbi:hypothetical protein [Gulosibacter sp. 10]|uniref:hypothetical protein n=1 Tax=Gulosibacter sp. 10 TaxID=1255570 RepID=UPI001121BC68|nr:hypothetical protein [Gulosibacter sp. 10]
MTEADMADVIVDDETIGPVAGAIIGQKELAERLLAQSSTALSLGWLAHRWRTGLWVIEGAAASGTILAGPGSPVVEAARRPAPGSTLLWSAS